MKKSKPNSKNVKRKPVRTLQEVFLLTGSSTQLAAQLSLHAFTVENWRRCGIPLKYWDVLGRLYNLTPSELFEVSKNCKAKLRLPG